MKYHTLVALLAVGAALLCSVWAGNPGAEPTEDELLELVEERRAEVAVHVQNVAQLLDETNVQLEELRQAVADANIEGYVSEMRGITRAASHGSEIKTESKSASRAFFMIQKEFRIILRNAGEIEADLEYEDDDDGGDGLPTPDETPYHCNELVLPEGYSRNHEYPYICTYPELQNMDFATAEAYCNARAMRLTPVDSYVLQNLMIEYWILHPDVAFWYMALTYNLDENEYTWNGWTDLVPYQENHAQWAPGQPDHSQGLCTAADASQNYMWVSVPCDTEMPAYCLEIATNYIPG